MSEKIDTICGMWRRVSKKGIAYESGSVKEEITLKPTDKIMRFENVKKKSDRDPDVWICKTEKNLEND